MQHYCIYDILGRMPKYDYVKFSAGPQPFRLDDPQLDTKDFNEAISYLQKRKKGTITATVRVPIDTEVFAILTKEAIGVRLAILQYSDPNVDSTHLT